MADVDMDEDDEHVQYEAYMSALDESERKSVSELLQREPDQSVATVVVRS